MTLQWADEDTEYRRQARAELDAFMARYCTLSARVSAGERLAGAGKRRPDGETAARMLEGDHPDIAVHIRAEADEPCLRTTDGLLAEAAIDVALTLPPVEAVRRLGAVGGSPVADRLIADAFARGRLLAHVLSGLREAFKGTPFFFGDDEGAQGGIVDDARAALVSARERWADPAARSFRDLHMQIRWAPVVSLVEPVHVLMGPLSKAAPVEAMAMLDMMPSALDAALVLEAVRLSVERYEPWANAVCVAPAAWDEEGWLGDRDKALRGLALPVLLWCAEDRLHDVNEDGPGLATPADVASTVRGRDDGAVTAWRWCADLIEQADRAERNGRGGPQNGRWRVAQALAASGGWNTFNPGFGSDCLLLEAAQRLALDASDAPPRLAELFPTSPEAFLDGRCGADLSSAAFGLVGGIGPMLNGQPLYGLATRILSKGLWGEDGPTRLKSLWHRALVLRELAAGGVLRHARGDRRSPDDPLHLVIALGIAAIEMITRGVNGDANGIACQLEGMLAECEPWDMLGHPHLSASFVELRSAKSID